MLLLSITLDEVVRLGKVLHYGFFVPPFGGTCNKVPPLDFPSIFFYVEMIYWIFLLTISIFDTFLAFWDVLMDVCKTFLTLFNVKNKTSQLESYCATSLVQLTKIRSSLI